MFKHLLSQITLKLFKVQKGETLLTPTHLSFFCQLVVRGKLLKGTSECHVEMDPSEANDKLPFINYDK